MNWNQVIEQPGFSKLDSAQQDIVRQRWVDEVYLPQAKEAGWSQEDVAALRQEQLSGYDNGQGYVSSFASSVGRGVAGSVSGLIGGAGAILDSPDLTETADSMDAAVSDYLPVNPSMKYTNLAGQAVGQAGSLLATGGVAGGIGKAIGGLRAGTAAAEAAVLGTGGISEARDAAKEADQYGMTGEERALKIASGVLTGIGTEYLPFGLGAETAAIKRLLGAGEKAVGKRAFGVAGDVATEAAEESIGQVANNAFTQALAPEGVQTPDLTSGVGDPAFGGAIGGATFGAANSLTGPNTPPAAVAANGAPLPPPTGFQTVPPATLAGRASAVASASAAPAPAPVTEEELAAMEIPPERVVIVAGAIATSPGPAVEAEVIQTAQIAAAVQARQTANAAASVITPPAAKTKTEAQNFLYKVDDGNGGTFNVSIVEQDRASADARVAKRFPDKTATFSSEDTVSVAEAHALVTLAQQAKQDGIDVTKMSREEYVDYAVSHGVVLTGNNIRMAASLRGSENIYDAQEAVGLRSQHGMTGAKATTAFDAMAEKWKAMASTSVDAGQKGGGGITTLNHADGWVNFAINAAGKKGRSASKVYAGFGQNFDAALTQDRVLELLAALHDEGFHGQFKFGESGAFMQRLGDQLVAHGITDADTSIATKVFQDLSAKWGVDVEISSGADGNDSSGKHTSYSELLAEKTLKAASNRQSTTAASSPASLHAQKTAQPVPPSPATTEDPAAVPVPVVQSEPIAPEAAPADAVEELPALIDSAAIPNPAPELKQEAAVVQNPAPAAEPIAEYQAPDQEPYEVADGNLLASSFTPEGSSLNDKDPVTSDAARRELSAFAQSSVERAGSIFAALGASPVTRPDGSNPGVQISGGTGRVVFAVEPGIVDPGADGSDRVPGGRTLGQAKQLAASVIEEELIHAAWLSGLRDQVIQSGPVAPASIAARVSNLARQQYDELRSEAESEPELAQFLLDSWNSYRFSPSKPSKVPLNSMADLNAMIAENPSSAENLLGEMIRQVAQRWRSGITTEQAKANWWVKLTKWLKDALRRIATASDSIKDGKYAASVRAAAESSLKRLEAAEQQAATVAPAPAAPSADANFLESPALEPPLPSPPDAPGIFEKWFGNNKKVVSETKLYEARNATRAALEVPLFAGIDDSHTPGAPLEEAIGSLTPDQRTALHDRVVSDLARMTGTEAEAAAYADELRTYLDTTELAGQRQVSPAALQYTNLVQVAAALSGIHGQTAAFATIINTDNDQLRFDTGTASLLRSDLGRLLGSQAGIGARIAEFARIISATNNDGLKRLGLTDATIAILGDAIANKTLSANEVEAIFAESTTSPQGPLIESAMAKLQRYVDAAARAAQTAQAAAGTGSRNRKPQTLDEYAEALAESLLKEAGEKLPPNERQLLRKAVMDWIRSDKPESALVEVLAEFGISAEPANSLAAAAAEKRTMLEAEREERKKRVPEKLAKTILGDAIGPLVPKLPIGKIVKAFMGAPAHHRNSAAWRQLQITNWLTENGVDAALAARLTVNMDEIVAKVMANLIYQEQEKYVIGKKGVGTQAVSNSEFAKRFRENKDAIRSAIRVGLMTDGTPWQAWFSSVTGIQPLTAAEQSQIAAWETILSGDRYFPSEKGVAAAKLRDLMDSRFGKAVSGWELLAASYDASALSSGTTMAVQFSGPVGKLAATVFSDMASMLYRPSSAVDVMDSFLASVETYAAELPNAFRYDTGGNFAADSAMKMGDVAPLKKDMAKQRAILANPNASMAAKSVAVVRFVRSAQDYLRQAMNAADSAAVAGFQRYFETREVRRLMRANGITKAEVAATMKADGFTADAAELQADALGYDGTLKKRYVGDAMWNRWKEIVTAHASTPAEHQLRIASLLHDAEVEAEFQAFVGNKRDQPAPWNITDWSLGKIQSIGEKLFADARKRAEAGQKASGSIERMIWRSVLGFVGIPLNAARAAMWYSPFSLLSFANYYAYTKSKAGENPYERSLGNAIQVRQRIKESLLGNTILIVAIAALKGLQEDDDWKINGYGPDPSKFPEEAKAWRRLHVPFSIEKIENGKAINVPFQRGTLEPLKAPLMMLAGWSDAAMDSKLAKEDAPSQGDLMMGALRQLGLSSITTGMRNIGGMRDALQRGMDGKSLTSQAGFSAAPLAPYSGSIRWIRSWTQPELLEKGFWNNMPIALPGHVRLPALNIFGQTLRPDPSPSEMVNRQFSGLPPGYSRTIAPEDQKLHGWMQRTGKQPTAYSKLDVEKKILRTITDDEWYAYTLASGKVRYGQLMAAIDGTLPIERTVKIPGPQPDRKIKAPMKKGLADIDPADKEAMKEASAILQDIGADAHLAGLEAIGEGPPEKKKPEKKKAASIY